MAVSLNGGGGRRGRYRPLSEINVTPLVDVMLVLLIIFMVTAPLMSNVVNVDLPKVATNAMNQDSQPITVSVDAQGLVYLQEQKVELPDLVTRLQAIVQDNKDRRIFVRGDKANSYGRIIEVMGTIVLGGFTKAALMSEPPVGMNLPTETPPAPAATPPATPAVIGPATVPADGKPSPARQGNG
jgi:biopolymer transport protein TolR